MFNSTGISLGNNVDDGDGMIWLDEVNCTGFESKLTDCLHAGWSEEDCTHPEDVGLYCYNIYPGLFPVYIKKKNQKPRFLENITLNVTFL